MEELLKRIWGAVQRSPEEVDAYEDLYHICLEAEKTDERLALGYLKKLSGQLEHQVPLCKKDGVMQDMFYLHKKTLLCAAPLDFES